MEDIGALWAFIVLVMATVGIKTILGAFVLGQWGWVLAVLLVTFLMWMMAEDNS